MKNFLAVLVTGLFLMPAWSQDSLNVAELLKDERLLTALENDTLQAIDSLFVQGTNKDLKLDFTAKLKDSVVYSLEDYPFAAKIDSLWLEELTGTYLFDSIHSIVENIDFEEDIDYPELPTDTLKLRLERLNAMTPFHIEYNPSLERVIKMYLKRHRPTMERLMGVSRYYFPLFEATFDKHDIPLELKYLALVESGLRPRAKSRVGATGLWQFMFSTAKLYGMDVSSYVDDRMDPTTSTEGAARYLSRLYEMFGDWDLALASYNSGPGNVSKAIRRSGGYKNYWNIRRFLPRETAGYVPSFQAFLYIFEYAEEHGYQPQNGEIHFLQTDTVLVKGQIALDQIAKYTGTPLEAIQFLNPAYKLDIIPFIEGREYYLRLPISTIGKFVANEEGIYAAAKAEFEAREKILPKYFEEESQITYRVRSGDYLGKIAERYGVGVSQIKRWNNLRSNNLRVGQRLIIYPTKSVSSNSSSATKKKPESANAKTYVVKEGDSLWKIAQQFPGVSPENLKVWNDISGINLKPGMKLIVSN